MTLRRTAARTVALSAAVALLATACGGDDDGTTGNANQGTQEGKKGGTLTVLYQSDFEHLDPQRTYVSSAFSFISRLTTRTLLTYDSKPGKDGVKIVPDLLKDLGTQSEGGKSWKFTLKDNVKFEDGTPIKCADVKYGISRAFSSQITDGPHYPHNLLALEKKNGEPTYKGPYVPGPNGGFDTAVQCTDDKTIVFNLARPVGDFNNSSRFRRWS